MADEINYLDINERFPLAGKDNDSQVFRNNFTIIKENWELTKAILDSLEQNSAKINGTNDFAGNSITNAILSNLNYKVDTTRINGVTGDAVGNIYVDKADGVVHVIKAKRDLRINVQGFEDNLQYQVVRLLITTDDGPRRCDIVNPTEGGTISSNLPVKDTFGNPVVYALPGDVVTATIVDVFTYDGGRTLQAYIYTDYSGFLDDGTLPDDQVTTIDQIKDLFPLPDWYENEGNTDSYTNIEGTPILPDGTPADGLPTNLILITDPDGLGLCDQFFVGQNIRILGGVPLLDSDGNTQSFNDLKLDTSGLEIVSVEQSIGADIIFPDDATEEELATALNYNYRLHEIDLETGIVGNGVTSVGINVKPDAVFTNQDYIKVTFNRTTNSRGILVFRSVDDGDYLLTDILGPKQLGAVSNAIIYADYAGVSHTDASKKVLVDSTGKNFNYYSLATGMNHYPIVSPGEIVDIKGWMDTRIVEKSACNPDGSFTITIAEYGIFDYTVKLFLDDTAKVQAEIDRRATENINYLRLNNRTYNVSTLSLPNNFTLYGNTSTTIKQSDWVSSNEGNLISAKESVPYKISLKNITLDGNMQNQYLRSDSSTARINYLVDLAVADDVDIAVEQSLGNTLPGNLQLENVQIYNAIGGSIWIEKSRVLNIRNCQIGAQGMSDIYDYGPLKAGSCEDFIITDNIFKDHAGSVDISIGDRGVFSNNIVKACGSGVEVFAAKFLLSSPNVLIGANNEFLPGPDVFNSEYDLVNIELTRDTQFISDRFVYQENGETVDLTANSGELVGRIYQLRKIDNVEELYAEFKMPNDRRPIVMEFSPGLAANGEFAFKIENDFRTNEDVNYILTYGSYDALRTGFTGEDSTVPVGIEIDPNHVGLVYNITHTSFTNIASNFNPPLVDDLATSVTFEVSGDTQGLFEGTVVRMFGYAGTVGTQALNTVDGTITALSYIPDETGATSGVVVVKVTYSGAFVEGAGATLNSIDGEAITLSTQTSKILASGRVT